MPGFEDVKQVFEKATGFARPAKSDLRRLVRKRVPSAHRFADDGETPNNPRFPLLHYRGAVSLPGAFDPAAVLEDLFAMNGWRNSWRDSIYDFLHFHTQTHEVLGIARGSAQVRFGGSKGRTIKVKAGDVIVLPAGTGHRRISKSRDLLVVGAYPANGRYDEPKPSEVDAEEARAKIAKVMVPSRDPVYGAAGPLQHVWSARAKTKPRRNGQHKIASP